MGTRPAGTRRAVGAICLAIICVGTTACGGGGEAETTDDGKDSPKAEYSAEFNAVLDDVEERGESLESLPDDSPSQVAEILDQSADLIDDVESGIEGIDPPRDLEQLHEGYIDGMAAFADRARDLADLLRQGDPEAISAINDPQNPLTDYLAPTRKEAIAVLSFREAVSSGGYDIDINALPTNGEPS